MEGDAMKLLATACALILATAICDALIWSKVNAAHGGIISWAFCGLVYGALTVIERGEKS